jgi:hypothetical protein
VELGRIGELETKLMLVNEILSAKEVGDRYAVVDVSSTQKPTYRLVTASEVLMR